MLQAGIVANIPSLTPIDKLFTDDIEEGTKIYVECKYNTNFKKWIPYKKVDDEIDTINYVNSVQNCLDK